MRATESDSERVWNSQKTEIENMKQWDAVIKCE